MARIENTTVYPTVTPAMDDLLIATDVSDNNKTVTFLVSSLSGGAAVLQGLQSVLDTSNTATQNITLTGNIELVGGYIDLCQLYASGATGAAGQVLTSGGAAGCVTWTTPGAGGGGCCTLQQTTDAGASTTNTITTTGDLIMNGVNSQFNLNNGSDIVLSSTSTLTFVTGSTITDSAGATGSTGYVLTWNGTGVTWAAPAASACCTLQETLTAGNTATAIGIDFVGPSTTNFNASASIISAGGNTFSGTNTFSGILDIDGTVEDGVGSVGTAGQILSSTGSGVAWIANSGVPNLQAVLTAGDTAVEDINLTGIIDLTGSLVLGSSTTVSANGSVGTVGQYLTATATGVEWTSTAACCNLNDTLTVGATSALDITMTGSANITAPSMTPAILIANNGAGTAGQILSATASGIQWVDNNATGMTSFFMQGDGGTLQTITDGNTFQLLGDTGITTTAVNLDRKSVV